MYTRLTPWGTFAETMESMTEKACNAEEWAAFLSYAQRPNKATFDAFVSLIERPFSERKPACTPACLRAEAKAS
jgi:hypothetical protein